MKPQLLFLYLAAFVSIIGFSMVFPLLPFYAQRYGATPTHLGLLAASFSISQFFVSPIVGRISDRFGRKPILAVSLAGTAFSFFIFGKAQSLAWLFIARILHGIFSSGAFPIAAAYIGDITSKEERVKYMGRLTGTFSLGFIVGPAAAAFLSGKSFTLPFFAASFVALINSLFILFFLPESLTNKAEKLNIKEGLMNIKAMFSVFRGELGVLFFLLFSWAFAISNYQVAFPLLAQEKFSFTGIQIALVFAFVGFVAAFVQWVLLPRVVRVISEFLTLAIGVFGMAAGQFLISLSPQAISLVVFSSISTCGSGFLRPTANAIISKKTKEGQGTTMGLAFSFESLGRVIGPLIAGVLISFFGARSQFILTSFVFLIGLLLLIKAAPNFFNSEKKDK